MADGRQNFDDTNRFIAEMAKQVTALLEALGDYADAHARYAPQREMAKWIKNHGECSVYEVQGNCMNELRAELEDKNIPFLDMMDGKTLIVKSPDVEQINELNKQVLIAKTNFFQEVDAKDMEDAIAKTDRVKDKDILEIHGLDKYEYETLKNKSNDITRGFMVGKEAEGNDKYSMSVHAPRVFNSDPERTDFCKAYAQMAFSLYGDNKDIKKQQIDADEKLDKEVASLKGCENSHYVIGIDNPGRYIELNSQGFELHQAHMEKENVIDHQISFVSKNDPAYEVELQKALDTINNKTVLDSQQKLNNHISTKNRTEKTDRPEKDKRQKTISDMEKNVVAKADAMIKFGPKRDELREATPKEAFEIYEREMSSIMDGVIHGKSVKGYEKKDLNSISSEFQSANVDPSDYKMAVNMLNNIDAEQHRAKKKEKTKEKPAFSRDDDFDERALA